MTKAKTQPAFKIIEGAAQVTKAIDAYGKRSKAADKEFHILAVSVIVHADKHGDVTLADRLVANMSKGARTNAMRDYLLAYGKFGYDQKNKVFTFDKNKTSLIEDAILTPFWDFKPEAVYVPFDINAALAQLIKRAEKAMNNGEVVPEATVEALRNLVPQPVQA